MASKKSGAAAGNTYVISPQSPGDFFPARTAQEIMRRCLAEGLNQGHLVDVRAAKHPSEPYNAELTKPIAEAIRDKLKGALCCRASPQVSALLRSITLRRPPHNPSQRFARTATSCLCR
jgi:hypothetical protein